ncbi:hypothetical protein [Mycolicibacterium fluoranthenivorans]|uniref:Uncharacterized protein n=1 Tax=Mycolicibacterium fluoranthenivorans TaxID=258505 RepID=A0A7X5ZFD1_9MYCO|nr:hypothetical protein [Mycolicibacterium fluoranthenivorans]MCV7358504.1 hypothetical protein [Mycolicibacterium fluoranthenivorans]NIH98081.1 hypothetical protein [Mycolicibacterium fluoranthenivorans]
MMPTDDLAAIAHLDWKTVRCQCEMHGCDKDCKSNAAVQVEFHALDHCNTQAADTKINHFGNYTFLLCLKCLSDLTIVVAQHLVRLNMIGRYTCGTCGAPARDTRPDVLREVKQL